MTNGEIFRAAADYVKKYGWRRGGLGAYGGPRCASGAIRAVCGIDTEQVNGRWNDAGTEAMRIASERALLLLPTKTRPLDAIVLWNDAACQSAEEMALFEGLAFDEDLKAAAKAPAKPALIPATPEPVKETVGV